jgi:predicted phosphoribosyltransferase
VCLQSPVDFHAVGQFYRSFTQVEDEEVVAALAESRLAAGDARAS